jgi:hypothetical protein
MGLTVNSDYFLKQHYAVHLCNGEVCSLWGTSFSFKGLIKHAELDST